MVATQCRPNGLASASTVAINTIPLASSLNTNILSCHPNGQATNQSESQVWQHQSMTNPSSAPHDFGNQDAVPPLSIGGTAAVGQMMVDGALAEQMALADWDEDDERGPQPEDGPLDGAHSVERFFLGTPPSSLPASSPAGGARRDSPRTPLRKSSRRLTAREQKRAARRAMMTTHGSRLLFGASL